MLRAQIPGIGRSPKLAVVKNEKKERRPGRVRLEVVSSAAGFLLKVGPVTLLLDREAAEELMCLLAEALEPGDPLDIATTDSN